MRCLITGASGHVGSHLTRRLVAAGAEVAVLVRPESDLSRLAEARERVRVVRGDLWNLAEVADSIKATRPEVVFHLGWAGVTGDRRNDPAQLTRNVAASLDLLELAREAACGCWIGVGSQAEYGSSDEVLKEELPLRPTTPYGVGKAAVGMLTQKLCELYGMRYVWLRLLATYGPGDDERHLIPGVIRRLLAHTRPALTAGEQLWDYLYVADAAEAIYRTAKIESVQGVFNLGSGDALPVRAIVERIRDLINPSLPLGFGEISYPPNQVMRLQADITRLRSAIEWTPQTSLDEGLQRTVEWYREHKGVSQEG
jgi:nucleoside-diphosphate-sugar epimerase